MYWVDCQEIMKAKSAGSASKSTPKSRWGHSCVALPNNQIIIIGGYDGQYLNDIWSYDFASFSYEKMTFAGQDQYLYRSNHTSVYVESQNLIYVFGGGTAGRHRYNDVLKIDLNTKEITEVVAMGELPCPRTYHSATLIEDRYMVIIGGESKDDLDDLVVFDILNQKWMKKVRITGHMFQGRRFHTSNAVGKKVYVFGGCYKEYRTLNDMVVFDFENYLKSEGKDSVSCEIATEKCTLAGQVKPTSRWGHNSGVYKNKIYLFGGRNDKDLNDLWCFNVSKNKWKNVRSNTEPASRRRASSAFVGSAYVIFGGFDSVFYSDMHYIDVEGKQDKDLKITKSTFVQDYNAMINKEEYNGIVFKGVDGNVRANKALLLFRYLAALEKLPALLNNIKDYDGVNDYVVDLTIFGAKRQEIESMVCYLYSGEFNKEMSLKEAIIIRQLALSLDLHIVANRLQYKINKMYTHLQKALNLTKEDNSTMMEHKLNFSMIDNESPEEGYIAKTLSTTNEMNQISSCFQCLDRFYDVLFKVGTSLLRANKIVLTQRCAYFANMFNQDSMFKESKQKVIKISNVSSVHFSLILQFIYSDTLTFVEENPDFLIELLIHADYYGLQRLVDVYFNTLTSIVMLNSLKKFINSQTVFNILLVAYHYNAKNLENYCVNYVAMNEDIYEEQEFLEAMQIIDSSLLEILVEKIVKVKDMRFVRLSHLEKVRHSMKSRRQKDKVQSIQFEEFFKSRSYILIKEKQNSYKTMVQVAPHIDLSEIEQPIEHAPRLHFSKMPEFEIPKEPAVKRIPQSRKSLDFPAITFHVDKTPNSIEKRKKIINSLSSVKKVITTPRRRATDDITPYSNKISKKNNKGCSIF